MNKKEKRAALKSALTSRVEENKFIVVDELKFDEIKTKNVANVLKNLNVNKALVVLEDGMMLTQSFLQETSLMLRQLRLIQSMYMIF